MSGMGAAHSSRICKKQRRSCRKPRDACERLRRWGHVSNSDLVLWTCGSSLCSSCMEMTAHQLGDEANFSHILVSHESVTCSCGHRSTNTVWRGVWLQNCLLHHLGLSPHGVSNLCGLLWHCDFVLLPHSLSTRTYWARVWNAKRTSSSMNSIRPLVRSWWLKEKSC